MNGKVEPVSVDFVWFARLQDLDPYLAVFPAGEVPIQSPFPVTDPDLGESRFFEISCERLTLAEFRRLHEVLADPDRFYPLEVALLQGEYTRSRPLLLEVDRVELLRCVGTVCPF